MNGRQNTMTITWSNFKNFKATEFACPCGCNKAPDMDMMLIWILQAVRNKYGKPVNIKSGYRCQKYNDSLKGSVKNSDHIKKKAADFYVTGVTDTLEKRKTLMKWIIELPNVKYVYCNGWILYADGTNKTYNAPNMGNSIHISVK